MFFVISKILGFVTDPFNLIILLFLLGLVLLLRNSGAGKIFIFIGILVLFVCGLNVVPRYFMSILENRIPTASIRDDVDGIIVLTGMVNMKSSRAGLIELNSSADRIINGVILAKKHPQAKLIITGGSGSLIQNKTLKEADYLKKMSIDLGVKEERILIECESRNTHEHPEKLAKLIHREGIWVLVTSAYHMPRALGCFRKAGFNVLPYPVDYQNILDRYYSWSDLTTYWPSAGNFKKMNMALHEWVGLVAYRLVGYTDSFFPENEWKQPL